MTPTPAPAQAAGVERRRQTLLNIVTSPYIERLRMTVEQLHRCTAVHVATTPVHEIFNGKTVWQGDVEIFKIEKHPRAKKCYAWSHREGPNDQDERFVTVLEIPPVGSAQSAVRAQIAKDVKDSYSG